MKRMLENVTSWSQYYKLMENDQAAPANQANTANQAQANTMAPSQTPTATVQAQANTANQANANTAVAPVAQTTIANNSQAQTSNAQVNNAQTQAVAQTASTQAANGATNTQAPTVSPQVPAANPQSQIVAQNQMAQGQIAQESLKATSWASFNKINESLALPGGCLDIEATEYEKNLDKRNKARKNPKIVGNIGDKDAGEIGVHNYDPETGVPTGKLDSILKPRKSSKLILQGAK